jgi:hypothetical protein
MVTDSNNITREDSAPLSETIEIKDGYNVAFIYNTSSTGTAASTCQVTPKLL